MSSRGQSSIMWVGESGAVYACFVKILHQAMGERVDLQSVTDLEAAAALLQTAPISIVVLGPEWVNVRERRTAAARIYSTVHTVRILFCGEGVGEGGDEGDWMPMPLERGAVKAILSAVLGCQERMVQTEQREAALETLVQQRTLALNEAREELQQALDQARVMAQAAQDASEAKSRFFDQVSHDVRTPMGGIVGMADVLASSGLNEEQQECVDVLSESAEMLMNMLNDLLDISRIESGRLTMECIPFNLLDTLEVAGQLAAPKAEEKGVELLVYCEADVPEWVEGDPTRLRQVVNNLLNNAVKFTSEGHVLLKACRWQEQGDERSWMRLAVVDTGVGIAEDKQHAVFERFTQEDDSVVRAHGGSGLGLCICKDLVALMGGRIALNSRKGEGATFDVFLPCPVPENSEPVSALLPSSSELAAFRVLLVSRYPLRGDLMARKLRSIGVQVESVFSLGDASEKVEAVEAAFDLVFLEEQFVDGTAFDWVKRQELSRSQCVLLRCIGAMEPLASQEVNQRFRAVLHLPYRREALFRVIYRTCMQRMMAQQNLAAVMTTNDLFRPISRGERVLIVDESLSNRLVLRNFLQQYGILQVVELECAREVLQLGLVDWQFDLLFVSMHLEDMDGCELVMRLRRMEGWGAKPMVAMSTSDSSGDRLRCEAAGLNEYLAKPLREVGVRKVFRRFLGLSAGRE